MISNSGNARALRYAQPLILATPPRYLTRRGNQPRVSKRERRGNLQIWELSRIAGNTRRDPWNRKTTCGNRHVLLCLTRKQKVTAFYKTKWNLHENPQLHFAEFSHPYSKHESLCSILSHVSTPTHFLPSFLPSYPKHHSILHPYIVCVEMASSGQPPA